MTDSDEQLIEAHLASPSPEYVDALVMRHLGTVRDLAYRLCLCDTTADDIAQEVFIKVLRRLDQFRRDAKFSTWLYRITVNTAKEQLRRRRPTQAIADADAQPPTPEHETPDRRSTQRELADEIDKAMAGLSVKLRTALVLTSLNHLPAAEAAKIEGCSVATIHWRVHQARKELKQKLDRYLQP